MEEFDTVFYKKAITICVIGIIWNTILMIINALEVSGDPINFVVMHIVLTVCLIVFRMYFYRSTNRIKESNCRELENTFK